MAGGKEQQDLHVAEVVGEGLQRAGTQVSILLLDTQIRLARIII
jgi:hypothetical protein